MGRVHSVFTETISNTVVEEGKEKTNKSPKYPNRGVVVDVLFPETSIFVEKNGDRVAYASVSVFLHDEKSEPREKLFALSLSSKLSPGETVADACERWKAEFESLFCPDPRAEDALRRNGIKEEKLSDVGGKVSPEKYDALSLFVDFWLEFPLEAPEYASIGKRAGTEKAFDAFCIRKTGMSWDSLQGEKRMGLVSAMRSRLEKPGSSTGRRRP